MSDTLVYTDTIHRVGYTIINGTKIVQHTCVLPLNNPEAMNVTMTKLDATAYKAHRDICRNDFARFEDVAFDLQDEYIANRETE